MAEDEKKSSEANATQQNPDDELTDALQDEWQAWRETLEPGNIAPVEVTVKGDLPARSLAETELRAVVLSLPLACEIDGDDDS